MDSSRDITDLTICRFVFAAWVFICFLDRFLHFSLVLGPVSGLVSHGYLGVDGFFMLSGLVLMHAHREFDVTGMDSLSPVFSWPKWGAVWRFYLRRLGRVYPVHLVTLLIVLALMLAGLGRGWGGAYGGSWNVPAWVLSYACAGALLFPLLAMLLSYFARDVALQISIVMFPVLGVVYYYAGYRLEITSWLGLTRFFPEFILGMAMFRMAMVVADYNGVRRFFLWAGVGLTLGGAALSWDIMTIPGLWALIFACYLQHDAEMKPFFGRLPAMLFLGRLSYCFYMSFALAGMLVYALFLGLGWRIFGHGLLFALGVTVITFGLAVLLRGAVETPCRRLVNVWLHRSMPAENSPAVPTSHSLF